MTVEPATKDVCTCSQESEDNLANRVDKIFESFKGEKSELIPILQRIQREFGYLPEEAMSHVAEFIGEEESRVFGVATFYAQFKLIPTGRNTVRVCRGTACHVKGGARILREAQKRLGIKPGESTPDLEYALETVACIGACALAPTMVVNDDTYGQMTTKKVMEVLKTREDTEEN